MKSHLLRVCTLGLAVGVSAAAFAQSDIPVEYLRPLNNSVSVGFHVMNHGVTVKFGNLGTIPYIQQLVNPTLKDTARVYDNGYVNVDSYRTEEYQIDGTGAIVTDPDTGIAVLRPVVNGRYQVTVANLDANGVNIPDADGNPGFIITGDHLAYVGSLNTATGGSNAGQTNQTRDWSYNNSSQVQNGQIAMSDYSSTTQGGQFSGKGSSSAGVELQISHTFGKIGDRLEWGLAMSFGIGDINVKSSGSIPVTLHATTDYYSLMGAAAPAPSPDGGVTPAAPTYVDALSPSTAIPTDGSTAALTSQYQETTVPISQDPTAGSGNVSTSTGTAIVNGHWQIKGAYYLIHLGPTLRFDFTPKFALSGSVGPAIAISGTRYKFDETLLVYADGSQVGITQESNPERKLTTGYFGEFNAEYWVTSRTGFYGGVTYEKLGSFNQEAAFGRTAKVNLGSGAGFRFGLITRF